MDPSPECLQAAGASHKQTCVQCRHRKVSSHRPRLADMLLTSAPSSRFDVMEVFTAAVTVAGLDSRARFPSHWTGSKAAKMQPRSRLQSLRGDEGAKHVECAETKRSAAQAPFRIAPIANIAA